MTSAEFDANRLEARAGDGWTTLTELADTLVRDHQVPFRAAHGIAAHMVKGRRENPNQPLSALLADASRDVLGTPITYSEQALANILSPRHFVEVRKTPGPGARRDGPRVRRVESQLDADEEWWAGATGALASWPPPRSAEL